MNTSGHYDAAYTDPPLSRTRSDDLHRRAAQIGGYLSARSAAVVADRYGCGGFTGQRA
jgi:hypothetical protein